MRNTEGFSLIELVIAVSLSSFVLVGVAVIASQMVRSQVDGIRSGTVTGWSVVSFMAMVREIEEANVLAYPTVDGATEDAIMVCKNWSRAQSSADKRLNTADPVSVIYYCLDTADPSNLILRRYANVGAYPGVSCPAAGALLNCGAPAGTWPQSGVVGFRVERLSGADVFTRDNSIGGVRLRYVIGQQVGTTNQPVPKFTPFDVGIPMQKNYSNNALD